MIVSPMIGAEIICEIPPERITAAVDPELDLESASGTFWVNLRRLDDMTAREYLDIIGSVSDWVDVDAVDWMSTQIEITEVPYADVMTVWMYTVKEHGDIIRRTGIEAFWRSNGMTALGMPAIRLEVPE